MNSHIKKILISLLLIFAIILVVKSNYQQKSSTDKSFPTEVTKVEEIEDISRKFDNEKSTISENINKMEDVISSPLHDKHIPKSKESNSINNNKISSIENILSTEKNEKSIKNLKLNSIKKLSTDKFDQLVNDLAEESFSSQLSIEYKSLYTELFLNQSEIVDNSVYLERLECGKRVCMASLQYQDIKNFKDFYSKISLSNKSKIQALTYVKFINENETSNRIGLVFTAGDDKAGFSISNDG